MGHALPSGKRALRAYARRLGVPADPALARSAQQRLLGLPEVATARTAAVYAARPPEVPLDLAIRALAERGVRLAFPRVAGEELRLHEAGVAELAPGYRGLLEPAPTAPPVELRSVDVFAVPGLLFDRHGRRLGRGGGHYDRLLAAVRADACRVGLCYADRVVESLPAGAWDARLDVAVDVVVTERELIRPAREAAR